ncbi:MAG: hypothetical protein U0354_07835 [Candidatus Sericytochromatia bacterium]
MIKKKSLLISVSFFVLLSLPCYAGYDKDSGCSYPDATTKMPMKQWNQEWDQYTNCKNSYYARKKAERDRQKELEKKNDYLKKIEDFNKNNQNGSNLSGKKNNDKTNSPSISDKKKK